MHLTRFDLDHPVLHTPAVWHPDAPREDWAVLCFRRVVELSDSTQPSTLWVSASQRFVLHLDGKLIGRGPSRSDPMRWHVSHFDLPALEKGTHIMSAIVWHAGDHAGIGQLGGPGFFLIAAEGDDRLHQSMSTGETWRCVRDESRAPIDKHAWAPKTPYYPVGFGERIDAVDAPTDWRSEAFDDSEWQHAKVVCKAAFNIWGNVPLGHLLRPDPIPNMHEEPIDWHRVAEAPDSLRDDAQRWLRGEAPLTIGTSSNVRLLLDRGEVTNAYLALHTEGGAGASIRMVTAESLYKPDTLAKGNRDETEGKVARGHLDEFIPSGDRDVFEPLWYRSFRFIELTIETRDELLTLERFDVRATMYPLDEQSSVSIAGDDVGESEDDLAADFDVMWQISLRTARACAHETFYDCPHYEQAQFPGDTRVQAIYHYLVANDDRLARKAIDDFHASRLSEGLTQCRYPSRQVQIIPTFSLYWIGMLHDFVRYRGDVDFIRPYLPFALEVLNWFDSHVRDDGMLGKIGHAPFIDWTSAFKAGNAPQDADGGSSILTLLHGRAHRWTADLLEAIAQHDAAREHRTRADVFINATRQTCWDDAHRLLANTPARQSFSTHAQCEATLAGLLDTDAARAALDQAIANAAGDIAPPGSLYYRFYLIRALRACGYEARVFDVLDRWRGLLKGTGLTTWPESDADPPRSDCHAWSVTPAIEMIETVLGIQPNEPGFAGITLAPCLGPLPGVTGNVATPRGPITLRIQRSGKSTDANAPLRIDIDAPMPIHCPTIDRAFDAGKHCIELPVHL